MIAPVSPVTVPGPVAVIRAVTVAEEPVTSTSEAGLTILLA